MIVFFEWDTVSPARLREFYLCLQEHMADIIWVRSEGHREYRDVNVLASRKFLAGAMYYMDIRYEVMFNNDATATKLRLMFP